MGNETVVSAGETEQKITIDGKEMTAKEVKESMLMHSDYTKKTQEVAKERESLKQEAENLSDARALAEALQSQPELEVEVQKVVDSYNKKTAGLQDGSNAKNVEVERLTARLQAIEDANKNAEINNEMKTLVGNIEAALDKEGIKLTGVRDLVKDSVLVKIMQGAGKDIESIGSLVGKNVSMFKDAKLEKILGIKPDTAIVGDNGGKGGTQIGVTEVPLTHSKGFGSVMEKVLQGLSNNNT